MSDDTLIKTLDCIGALAKWFILQMLLYFLMPYWWNYEYGIGTMTLVFIYTAFHVIYWTFIPKNMQIKWLFLPYIIYSVIALVLYWIVDNWCSSAWFCLLLPLYGFVCWISTKLFRKYSKKINREYRFGKMMSSLVFVLLIFALKSFSVLWMCKEHGIIESERYDIIERRNYLVDKLVTTPQKVLDEMPFGIGTQFQGEWALYSCSMLSAALANISHLFPETKEENLQHIDSLINIVMKYVTMIR